MADIWEPYEKVKHRLQKYHLNYLGMDVFDPNYRINPVAIFWCIYIVWLYIIHIFTFKLVYGELRVFCFCSITLFIIMLINIRYYNFMFNHDIFLKLYEEIKKIYAEFTDEEVEEKQLFKKYGVLIWKIQSFTLIMLVVCYVVTFTTPIFVYLSTGDVILPFGFFIPGLDHKTNPGYAINYLQGLFHGLFSIISYSIMYIFFTLFVGGACYQLEALIIKVKRFDEKLQEKEVIKVKPQPKGMIKKVKPMAEPDEKVQVDPMSELKRLIQLHHNVLSYIGTVEKLFSMQHFCEFLLLGFDVVVALYVVTIEFWATGYVVISCMIIPVFLQCLYGVTVEIKCEKLTKQIYELHWYLLEIRERKVFVLFLMGAQQTQLLTCAGYVPLNLETFTKLFKFCYNFLMFLLKCHKTHFGEQ